MAFLLCHHVCVYIRLSDGNDPTWANLPCWEDRSGLGHADSNRMWKIGCYTYSLWSKFCCPSVSELLQKRAVRVISCSKYNAHTDPLFKQLNLLKVKDIFDLNALKLFYKLKQNCLPVYVTDMFQDFSREHEHNTRQSLVLNNVFSSSRNGENCIRFYLPLLVNDSSQCVLEKVTTHCYQGFISYIKKRMIDRYVAQCYVRLCYICNRNWWNASDV